MQLLSKFLKLCRFRKRSADEMLEIMICGYIREFRDQSKSIVPDAIETIINEYYPRTKKINYIGKFESDKYGLQVQTGRRSITGSCGDATVDQPLPTTLDAKYASAIYRWRAKATGRRVGEVYFGVISSVNYIRKQIQIPPRQIIRMEYEISNTDKCTLSFYIESWNNQLLSKVNLPKYAGNPKQKITWYPRFVVALNEYNRDVVVKLIPYWPLQLMQFEELGSGKFRL